MSEERDQPVAEEPVEGAAVEGVADEANAQGDDQPQLDDDGNPITPEAADDSEEIEHDGEKFRVPAKLKEAFLRQADYTQKTQALAEQRRTADAEVTQRRQEVEQQAEAAQATLTERVQLAQYEAQLEQFGQIDWADYERQFGAGAVATAMAQWRTLESQAGSLKTEITSKEDAHRLSSERATATALQEAEQLLAKEPGFGPEMVSKVAQTAHAYGFTADEVRDSFVGSDGKADVRTFKALAELAELRAYKAANEAKTTKAQTATKVAAVTPATTVKPAGGGQYKAGLNDELPVDEWLRRRNAGIDKRAKA